MPGLSILSQLPTEPTFGPVSPCWIYDHGQHFKTDSDRKSDGKLNYVLYSYYVCILIN